LLKEKKKRRKKKKFPFLFLCPPAQPMSPPASPPESRISLLRRKRIFPKKEISKTPKERHGDFSLRTPPPFLKLMNKEENTKK